MSKHRATRGGERRQQQHRHRAEVRPRYGRIAALTSAALLTGVSVLGSAGAFPSSADDKRASGDTAVEMAAEPTASATPDPTPGTDLVKPAPSRTGERGTTQAAKQRPAAVVRGNNVALPEGSGSGKRVVFSEGQQRVWLVDDRGRVSSTYLVSGSTLDNLDPGTYRVYSRSRHAVGIENSGTMQYFVRFTRGPSGAAIGFHDIPVTHGALAQTLDELGTPQSIGCIRQRREDAVRLWEFAPIGTTVVVTA